MEPGMEKSADRFLKIFKKATGPYSIASQKVSKIQESY
jgi:hypothetical protein